ncbi:hypothetical protein AVEN_237784-1, partial [Araneus ventricosus]
MGEMPILWAYQMTGYITFWVNIYTQERSREKGCHDCSLWIKYVLPEKFEAVSTQLGAFLRGFVTMDETWFHLYQLRQKSNQNNGLGGADLASQRAKTVPSSGKIMAIVFWDPRNQTSGGPVTTHGNERSVTVRGLYPKTRYFFRVKCLNALGESQYGAEVAVTTLEEPPRLAPKNLRAVATSSKSVNVSWE